MRLRLVVVAAFAVMALVPAVFAYSTGVLPGPSQASAGSSGLVTGTAYAIGPLAWPEEPLGLTTNGTAVLWEQRDRSADVAGLWSYDVRARTIERLLDRRATGQGAGFPSAFSDVIAWAAWTGRRGDGPPHIEAYDTATTRRWTVAPAGHDPSVAGGSIVWIEGDAVGGNDAIRGSNSLTDEEYSITADGGVRDVAAWGSWAAWIAGRGKTGAVWAGSYRDRTRYKLAAAGTAVAVGRDRVVWAAAIGHHSTAIVAWDRRTRHSTVLCRIVGSVSSLALSRRYAVWVTTRQKSAPRVWAYDFETGKATAVSDEGSRQVSPVIVSGTLYWADDRSGHWELYARSLQQ